MVGPVFRVTRTDTANVRPDGTGNGAKPLPPFVKAIRADPTGNVSTMRNRIRANVSPGGTVNSATTISTTAIQIRALMRSDVLTKLTDTNVLVKLAGMGRDVK